MSYLNYQVIDEVLNLDYVLLIELSTTLRELGYKNILEFYFKLPNKDIGALRKLYSDAIMIEVLKLMKYVKENTMEVYVNHRVEEPIVELK